MTRLGNSAFVPTVVDLFCGAGGLSLGFVQAGFIDTAAFDHYAPAIETYRRNVNQHAQQVEITEAIDIPKADVIAGGPPCQGFSSAGLRRLGDRRNSLVRVFATLVAAHRPNAFVFENVEGFLTAEGGKRVFDLLEPLIDAGYWIHLRKINAANYGVAQHRKRVLAIGGLGWAPNFPQPTHAAYGAPGAHHANENLPACPNVLEALAGLPKPSAPPGFPQGHYATELNQTDLARARLLAEGQTMMDLPIELHHESFKRRAFRRVKDGTPTERRGGAPAGLRRLKGGEPSKAITGGARGEFLHPVEDRPLTLRECARLQSFPDDFEFIGSASHQMQLIGNAVPPRLANAVATSLRKDLAMNENRRNEGRLLSFVPTMSNGMSPVLQSVTKAVHSRFGVCVVLEGLPLWD